MSHASSTYAKPLPKIDNWSRPFWEGCKQRVFRFQECPGCGQRWFPPAPCCPQCLNMETRWVNSSGRGVVYSWVVFHQLYFAGFANEIPYIVATIELEEGVRTISNLVGVNKEDVRIGMPVEVTFVDATEEVTIPVFRPRL